MRRRPRPTAWALPSGQTSAITACRSASSKADDANTVSAAGPTTSTSSVNSGVVQLSDSGSISASSVRIGKTLNSVSAPPAATVPVVLGSVAVGSEVTARYGRVDLSSGACGDRPPSFSENVPWPRWGSRKKVCQRVPGTGQSLASTLVTAPSICAS